MTNQNDFIKRADARQSVMREAPNLSYSIDRVPASDVLPVSEVAASVDEAIRILNALNGTGRLNYDDYCELHEVISSIGSKNARKADEET